jgi:hypothetical protein
LRSLTGQYSIQKNWRHYTYFSLSGAFRCAEGDAAGGLAELVAAEAALGAQVSINAPELARLQAVIGLCAPLASKREQAEEFASRARRAVAAQPRVSPYYLLPLKRLEQQLRTKSI